VRSQRPEQKYSGKAVSLFESTENLSENRKMGQLVQSK